MPALATTNGREPRSFGSLAAVLREIREDIADAVLDSALASLDHVAEEHRDGAVRSAATGAYFELHTVSEDDLGNLVRATFEAVYPDEPNSS